MPKFPSAFQSKLERTHFPVVIGPGVEEEEGTFLTTIKTIREFILTEEISLNLREEEEEEENWL
jgi:hypothetical protein